MNSPSTADNVCVFIAEVMVKVHVVDLKRECIAAPVSVRAYLNQTITEFKQLIAQVQNLISEWIHCSINLQRPI